MSHLAEIVGLLAALSAASERLVEIVKSVWPFLREANTDEEKEAQRKAALQVLGVGSGIVTAFLARVAVPDVVPGPDKIMATLALGVLAAGGSKFWNAVLEWILQVKNTAKQTAEKKALHVKTLKRSFNLPV